MTQKVSFFPKWNDPYLTELAAALRDAGWDCDLVDRKGLRLALINAIVGRGLVHLHWFEALSPRRRRIDGAMAWTYLPVLWLAGRRGRVIWTVHNVIPHEGYPPLMGPVFVRLLARSASRVLVHFDQTRSVVEARFGIAGKVFVTPAASFGRSHGPSIARSEARASVCHSLGDDAKLFIQIGNLRAYKQPATTVLAFRDAAPATARLLIAGTCRDESIKTQILQAAGDDPRIIVRFGYLSNQELVAALCAADWSICPYRTIDNPGAANLTVAYNCPIIAPALPVVCEVTTGHPSILYPTDGPVRKRLADAIAEAAQVESLAGGISVGTPSTRREQADQTAEHYLAALGAAHLP